MLGHVLQGPPRFTHTFKAEADTRKKRGPPTHTHQNKPTTQPSNSSKERKKQTQHVATPRKQKDRQARRSTSRTQDHGWTGKPTTFPLTPGSKTRVLHANTNKGKQNKQTTNKQHVPATHVSYQSTKTDTTNNTKKNKARPRREKGERVDQPKVGKRFQPPPSGRRAILPIHEGVGRDGLSAGGG